MGVYTGILQFRGVRVRGQGRGQGPTPEVVGLNIDALRVGTACLSTQFFLFFTPGRGP